MDVTIGERIKAARLLVVPVLSTREVDRLVGFNEGTTWSVEEGGEKGPLAGTLDRIVQVLGLSLEYAIRGVGKRPTRRAVETAVARARARARAA